MEKFFRFKHAFWFLFIFMCSFAAFYTPVAAENVDCTVSSKQMVVIDTNGDHIPNPGLNSTDDAYLVGDYDTSTQTLRVYAEGGVGIYPQMSGGFPEAWFYQFNSTDSSFTETAGSGGVTSLNHFHDEWMMKFVPSKVEGSATFNQFDFYWINDNNNENSEYPGLSWKAGDKAATVTLKDKTGDGYFDTAEGEIFLSQLLPWLPSLLLDETLTAYPSQTDRQYLVLPQAMNVYQVTPFQEIGPFDVFIPMQNGEVMNLECGGQTLIQGTRSKAGDTGTYTYYLPYYETAGVLSTGVAVANASDSQSASVTVKIYNQTGQLKETTNKNLSPLGQSSFTVGKGLGTKGWVLVESDQPLTGLCFVFDTSMNLLMFDITLIPNLSMKLVVPHVAQNQNWDTDIYICNSHSTAVTVTLTFRSTTGQVIGTKDVVIPAMGSGVYQVGTELGTGSGSVIIEPDSSGPGGVAAFALYYNANKMVGGLAKAGISAVEP